jgi:hypothetical protein
MKMFAATLRKNCSTDTKLYGTAYSTAINRYGIKINLSLFIRKFGEIVSFSL